jgi:hypothetical protein
LENVPTGHDAQPRSQAAVLVWQLPVPDGHPLPPVPAGSKPKQLSLAAFTSCLAGHALQLMEPSPNVPVSQSWHVYDAEMGGLNIIFLNLPPGHDAASTVVSWPQ